MPPDRPGRRSRLRTRIADVLAPGTGKHRINGMRVQDEMNSMIIGETSPGTEKLPVGSETETTLHLYNPFTTPEVMAKG